MPSVLWWGRSNPNYSRNRVVINLFSDLGWMMDFFHPVASQVGFIEAYLHHLNRPDIIWVPCFRQRDILSASYWSRKWGVPLIVDPLISAYEKEVFERNKWPADSKSAKKRRFREANLFSKADIVIADTLAHAEYFKEDLYVKPDKICVLYVGAETDLFTPMPPPLPQPPFEVLFYGSFLKLQGVDVIVKAAQKNQDLDIKWVLLGDGDLRADIEREAHGLNNITFEPWIKYDRLPGRMAKAHVLLGIFGTTLKADLVIPNKVFQAMAVGRPVITRRSKAYPITLDRSNVIGWVPEGDPISLAALVRKWIQEPHKLALRGKETRKLFDVFFSEEKLREMLKNILEKVLNRKDF